MKNLKPANIILALSLAMTVWGFSCCTNLNNAEQNLINELKSKGLVAQTISADNFYKGIAPANFESVSGASYKPSYNEEPEIPAQCWIETSYGTQNACKYCHTDYLAEIKHGNAFPLSDDQELYSFPSPNLNRILWQNIIYPQNIEQRLTAEGIDIPSINDVEYVRYDNWTPAFNQARGNGDTEWLNSQAENKDYILFPALNPNHLYPYNSQNPTSNNTHGYIDNEGFVRSEKNEYTGWRAVNFFPYAIFTPLTGSVSGIYIRLPKIFMMENDSININVYKQNLNVLEKNIKNQEYSQTHYRGDASSIEVQKGFYPVGTEFAHPLHYVDLNADGEMGVAIDGVVGNNNYSFEFPGTRSKRVKEIRYMYKWKEVGLGDIGEEEEEEEENSFGTYIGVEGQGWIDNGAGWLIAAFIENRHGELRPQTTEELAQCLGCHAKVGNTVDAVWSFQRKLPEMEGWAEMSYGKYNSNDPSITKLQDYQNKQVNMGELGYFYHSVIGADLYGVMPAEIRDELLQFAAKVKIELPFSAQEILDDEALKHMAKDDRMPRLLARQELMREYSKSLEYLQYFADDDKYYVKGNIFYPSLSTVKANILGYRKIVLDQSFNLGKDVFGNTSDHIPFTFRSDGTVTDEKGDTIPTGHVIYSRPFDDEGIGTTPTGIVYGNAFDNNGNPVSVFTEEDVFAGKITFSGTLDKYYNPILSDETIRKE